MWNNFLEKIKSGDIKTLARCISLIENEAKGFEQFMQSLPKSEVPIIGITGPPGAGKSTLTDALIGHYVSAGKKIAVLCIDPSSAFNLGALLGDRIRMSSWYNNENVYIRSLASRGSLGGLNPKVIEITDILKTANFDYIILETVGVGQSEIEIAGLADATVVTLVPEAGDEIQTMKAGIMEIADVFVVNKADRIGADTFVKNLRLMLAPTFTTHKEEVEVIKTVASKSQGIAELELAISKVLKNNKNDKKMWLLTEKAFQLIQKEKMRGITKVDLKNKIEKDALFNVYTFVYKFFNNN